VDTTKLAKQLIVHEGLSLKIYTDTAGKVSVGVGHNLTDKGLTQSQVMSILQTDISDTLNLLQAHFPWFGVLDDVRQRAIADLTFDLMEKMLEFKKMIAAIQMQDWAGAHDELLNSAFAHEAPNRAKDLSIMLLTGVDLPGIK